MRARFLFPIVVGLLAVGLGAVWFAPNAPAAATGVPIRIEAVDLERAPVDGARIEVRRLDEQNIHGPSALIHRATTAAGRVEVRLPSDGLFVIKALPPDPNPDGLVNHDDADGASTWPLGSGCDGPASCTVVRVAAGITTIDGVGVDEHRTTFRFQFRRPTPPPPAAAPIQVPAHRWVISGQVFDVTPGVAPDTLLGGATVWLTPLDPSSTVAPAVKTTAASGFRDASFDVVPGRYQATFVPPGGYVAAGPVTQIIDMPADMLLVPTDFRAVRIDSLIRQSAPTQTRPPRANGEAASAPDGAPTTTAPPTTAPSTTAPTTTAPPTTEPPATPREEPPVEVPSDGDGRIEVPRCPDGHVRVQTPEGPRCVILRAPSPTSR